MAEHDKTILYRLYDLISCRGKQFFKFREIKKVKNQRENSLQAQNESMNEIYAPDKIRIKEEMKMESLI
jgi:hypothetical protein